MNLLMLAPAIHEQLLFLPRLERGWVDVCLRAPQTVAAVSEWEGQYSSGTMIWPQRNSVSILKPRCNGIDDFAKANKHLPIKGS